MSSCSKYKLCRYVLIATTKFYLYGLLGHNLWTCMCTLSFFGGWGGDGEVGGENWTELNRRPFMEKKLSFVDEMDKHGKLHKL